MPPAKKGGGPPSQRGAKPGSQRGAKKAAGGAKKKSGSLEPVNESGATAAAPEEVLELLDDVLAPLQALVDRAQAELNELAKQHGKLVNQVVKPVEEKTLAQKAEDFKAEEDQMKRRTSALRIWKSFAAQRLAEMASSLEAALAADNKLRDLFNKIDADLGGSIDESELHEALVAAGKKVTPEFVKEMFHAADYDDGGDIDFSEFADVIKGIKASKAAFNLQRGVRRHQDAKKKKVLLTREELDAQLAANLLQQSPKAMVETWDRSRKRGSISLVEFRQGCRFRFMLNFDNKHLDEVWDGTWEGTGWGRGREGVGRGWGGGGDGRQHAPTDSAAAAASARPPPPPPPPPPTKSMHLLLLLLLLHVALLPSALPPTVSLSSASPLALLSPSSRPPLALLCLSSPSPLALLCLSSRPPSRRQIFERFDKDRDGFLSLPELKELFRSVASQQKATKAEAASTEQRQAELASKLDGLIAEVAACRGAYEAHTAAEGALKAHKGARHLDAKIGDKLKGKIKSADNPKAVLSLDDVVAQWDIGRKTEGFVDAEEFAMLASAALAAKTAPSAADLEETFTALDASVNGEGGGKGKIPIKPLLQALINSEKMRVATGVRLAEEAAQARQAALAAQAKVKAITAPPPPPEPEPEAAPAAEPSAAATAATYDVSGGDELLAKLDALEKLPSRPSAASTGMPAATEGAPATAEVA